MKEIGSEFEYNSFNTGKNDYLNLVNFPKKYVLSGRTGLFIIANEIKRKGIDSVALPSYCCFSMIRPFLDTGFKIEFYDEFLLPSSKAVLVMDYFGFLSNETLFFTKKCSSNNKIIIVDATQTAFSKSDTYNYADYVVVSYRKWFDCLCAAIYCKDGFQLEETMVIYEEFEKNWKKASMLKKEYLRDSLISKSEFLNLFSLANSQLKNNYKNYCANIDEIKKLEKVNSDDIRNKRRKNAKVLIDGLNKYRILLFDNLNENDCPLFVPILLDKSKKIKIRNELIKNNIYCPCHWPIEDCKKQVLTKYHEEELSLICDQRYSVEDMKTIIKIVEKNLQD